MNKLQLTEEQRIKLLEMCSVLFPEIYSTDRNIFDIRDGDDNIPCIMHYDNQAGSWDIIIHWFEFCIRILANKIYDLQYSLEVQADILAEDYYKMIMNNHPVDYLYEKFEKLTPNTNEQQGNSSEKEVY